MSWELIPQLFYDLLARFVPGSIVLTFAIAAVVGPAESLALLQRDAESASRLGPVTIFLLFSYLIAITGVELGNGPSVVS
jgi:hypothetical protein